MADAMSMLNQGCLRQITESNLATPQPIVQCVQIKPMASPNNTERYRVVMSDSINFMQGMLGQRKYTQTRKLKEFQSSYVKDKYVLILLDLDILEEYGELDKLGHPVAIEPKVEGAEDAKPQPGNIASNGFYGNKPQQAQQAQPQQQRQVQMRSNGNSGGAHGSIYPIEALSPYAHKWTIKARCTQKSDIKTWHKNTGEGKLFSANFLDDSGEIRATGFNDAVDTWYEVIQEGSVYYISSPCRVQLAKKQFSNVNNDYELTFERDTVVEKAEDTEGVPQINFNFTTMEELQNVEKDATIDCIGVLQEVGEVSEIVSKSSGKPYSKRELTLVDNTGYNVRLTVWGKTADSFEVNPESVVAFKGVKVSDFNGRSLSLLSSGSMTVDPDIEQAYKLKGWYDGSGRNEQFQSHANTMSTVNATGGKRDETKTIAQVRDENLGMTEDTDWFSVKATIIYIRQENVAYPACRTESAQGNCNKKVTEIELNQWRCEKCDVSWDKPNWRYILSLNVSDHTGQIWLSAFDEASTLIMGVSANDFMAMKDNANQDEAGQGKLTQVFQEANCKTFTFRCKAKMDTFQDQQRVRYQVQYAKPLDFKAEAKKLADVIKQYSIGSDSLFVT